MSNLNKLKKKEQFLKKVQMVDKEEVLECLKENNDEKDLYTYFVTKDAFSQGNIDESEFKEWIHKLYSDWYFLHKNSSVNIASLKLLTNGLYSPLKLSQNDCFELIKSEKFKDALPITFQYINRLEDKFFTLIKIDELYNRKVEQVENNARLYINLPANKILDFAKEFLDRIYMEEIPAVLKFLNNDSRSDTVIVYCDYEYAEQIVHVIDGIQNDFPHKLAGVGSVSPLLGILGEYIGFGEQPSDMSTYFKSRAGALTSIRQLASNYVLKHNIVLPEEQVIFRADGTSYTPSEYLAFLIERNAIKLLDDKINKMENLQIAFDEREFEKLHKLRENIFNNIDISRQVNDLKKSLTSGEIFQLKIKGVGKDSYNYLSKLYKVFSSNSPAKSLRVSGSDKKNVVNQNLFKLTENFLNINTRNFLNLYFKERLTYALEIFVKEQLDKLKYTRQSSILHNLKKKSYTELNTILQSIIDDEDDGREYLDNCIHDYVRILSTNALENVEVYIRGNKILIDSDVNADLLYCFPVLQEQVDNLSIDPVFIDNTIRHFDINPDNIAINFNTQNVCKVRAKHVEGEREYYYNPEFIYKNL